MIRILLVGPLPPPMGGDTRHFATLLEDLRANDAFEVTAINTSRGETHSNYLRNAAVAVRTVAAILGNMRRHDVLSYHSSDRGMLMFGGLVLALGRLFGKPVVLRLFGGSFGDFYQQSGRLGRAVIRRILSADVTLLQTRRTIAQLRPFATGRLEWFSTYIKREALPPPHVTEMQAGQRRCSRFVFLGHVRRAKGIDTMLEAASRLPDAVSIDIYGPLDEYTEDEIQRRGMGRVRYRGFLTHDEVDRELWEYDCLVLPTWHRGEGYPGVIAEAYAHGLPVITTNWMAIPEIVDPESGILVEPHDTDAFVGAITTLCDDVPRWLAMKRAALAKAEQFDHRLWAMHFEKLCAELVVR